VGVTGINEAISPDIQMKMKLMGTITFFEGFTSNDLLYTAQIADWLKMGPGDVIFAEGDLGSAFWIVLKGTVRVVKRMPDIPDQVLAFIPTGECFGEMSIISGQPRTAHCIASEEVFLFRIDGQKLSRTTDALQLKFYKRFAVVLAARLARTSQNLMNRPPAAV